jgi:hypothetical protein
VVVYGRQPRKTREVTKRNADLPPWLRLVDSRVSCGQTGDWRPLNGRFDPPAALHRAELRSHPRVARSSEAEVFDLGESGLKEAGYRGTGRLRNGAPRQKKARSGLLRAFWFLADQSLMRPLAVVRRTGNCGCPTCITVRMKANDSPAPLSCSKRDYDVRSCLCKSRPSASLTHFSCVSYSVVMNRHFLSVLLPQDGLVRRCLPDHGPKRKRETLIQPVRVPHRDRVSLALSSPPNRLDRFCHSAF